MFCVGGAELAAHQTVRRFTGQPYLWYGASQEQAHRHDLRIDLRSMQGFQASASLLALALLPRLCLGENSSATPVTPVLEAVDLQAATSKASAADQHKQKEMQDLLHWAIGWFFVQASSWTSSSSWKLKVQLLLQNLTQQMSQSIAILTS